MPTGEEIYADWAGPWLLCDGEYHLPDWAVVAGLFLDYHGDLFPAGTFFVALRRFVSASGSGEAIAEDDPSMLWSRGLRSWENGEILQNDPTVVLTLPITQAEVLVQALQALSVNGKHVDLNVLCQSDYGRTYGTNVYQYVAQFPQINLAVELWGSSGRPELMPDSTHYQDGTPIPYGCYIWLMFWWSDHTYTQPWMLTLPLAGGFAGWLDSFLAQQGSYLDMLAPAGFTVEYWLPDEIDGAHAVAYGERVDWDHLHEQAERVAMHHILAIGADRARVSVGDYRLADFNLGDLDADELAEWNRRYGEEAA